MQASKILEPHLLLLYLVHKHELNPTYASTEENDHDQSPALFGKNGVLENES